MSDAFYTTLRDRTAGPLIEKYGLALTLRRTVPATYNPNTGSNSPATITVATIAATADSFTDSGNGFITAGFLNGMLLAVSGFTASGNNGAFTITNLAAGEIHVTPSPAEVEVSGDSVTIYNNLVTDYPCYGVIESYKAYMVANSLVQQGDKRLILSAKNLPIVPQIGDQFIMTDGTWFIPGNQQSLVSAFQPIQPLEPGGIPVIYTIQIRK